MKETYDHTRQRQRIADHQDPYFALKHADAKAQVNNFDTDLSEALRDTDFHTKDITESNLSKLAQPQLEGRLNYYEREYLFERNPQIRTECKREIERTRTEIRRRKFVARTEAERLFRELQSKIEV